MATAVQNPVDALPPSREERAEEHAEETEAQEEPELKLPKGVKIKRTPKPDKQRHEMQVGDNFGPRARFCAQSLHLFSRLARTRFLRCIIR